MDPLTNGSITQSESHPSTQNQTQSQFQTDKGKINDEKAEWDAKTVEIWINICVEEVLAGNRPGTHFTKLGWKNLMIKFTKATGKKYDRSQHKNRWDTFKRKWQLWQSLIKGESGLEWDPVRQTVDASDEWWEAKIEKFPKVAAFRVKGLEHKDALDILFSDGTVVGRVAQASSSNAMPTHVQTSEKDDNSASDEARDDEDHITANANNQVSPNRPQKRARIEISMDLLTNGSIPQSQLQPSAHNQTQSQSQTKKEKVNREKAEWDAKTTEIWINICVEEVLAGNRPGTHFTKPGWKNLMAKFTKATGKKYARSQHKNRWDTFKRKWQLWQYLVREESELRWDPIRQTVDASDEWWQAKIEKCPKVAVFQGKGLEYKYELDILFSDVAAVGRVAQASSSDALPTHVQTSEKDDNSSSNEAWDDGHITANVNNQIAPDRPRNKTHIEISMDPSTNENITQSQPHPSTQNQTQSQSQAKRRKINDEKAEWDAKTTEIWINICVEEVLAGNRPGTHFSKLGWKNLMTKFTKATGKKYARSQHKNRWDAFKRKWQLWQFLVRGECGLGWDPVRHTVDASDEWWEAKIEKFPKVAAFQAKGLKHKDELDILFSDVAVVGKTTWASSSNALPTHVQASEKDDNSASDEARDDEDHITTDVNSQVASDRPRKKTHTEISMNRRKNKASTEKKLSKTLELVVDAVENGTTQSIRFDRPGCSIHEIMQLVEEIPGVVRGDNLYMFAAQLFLKRENREMFEVLTEPSIRLAWLKSMEQQHLSSSSNRGGHL